MTQNKIVGQIIGTDTTDTDVGDGVVRNANAGASTAATATSGAVAGGGVEGAQRFKDKDERDKQARLDAIEAEKQLHEQQMRQATVGVAEGETATNAGLDQVEAFNSGYSARGKASTDSRDGIVINYDDQTTVEQEDKYNTRRDISRQRAHQARRTRVVQSSIMVEEAMREAEREAAREERRAKRYGEEFKKEPEPEFEIGF